jgi:transcriptional regulator with XRE-family HTH domain
MTVAEAAEEAGVTEAEWLAVEEGRRAPTLGVLLGMARSLGCSAGDLLAGEREGPSISENAEQAAALFEQCPADVQQSILNLLRGVMGAPPRKKP